jgi:tyrosinase
MPCSLIILRTSWYAVVSDIRGVDESLSVSTNERRTSWDGVEGRLENKELEDGTVIQKNPDMGYCPHSQVLFGTWHRPYLALFEVSATTLTFSLFMADLAKQKLQSVAKAIANRFPTATRSRYQDAATRMRVPYWDWAKAVPNDQPVIPSALSNEKTRVIFPNGTSASIGNPLFDYDFHPLDNTQINGTVSRAPQSKLRY